MTTAIAEIEEKTPAEQPTPALPKFAHCLINKDTTILTVQIGDAEFRLRSVTAGENADIMSECRLPIHKGDDGKLTINYDTDRMIPLVVVAALGAHKTIGREGWSLPDDVTPDAVSDLDSDVVNALYIEHQRFFRADRFGAVKSGSGDSVVAH